MPAEPRVFPVGRLDVDTEGLLLLTNDGELTHRLTHPSLGVEKEYLAEVAGGASAPGALRRLRDGVELDDGVDRAGQGRRSPSPGVLRITIHEGRNRQVRRMCEAVGHPVQRLVRARIGPLRDRPAGAGRVARARRLAEVRQPRCASVVATGTGSLTGRDGDSSPTRPRRANVIGLGLIGGSIALALRERGLARHRRRPRSGASPTRRCERGIVDAVGLDADADDHVRRRAGAGRRRPGQAGAGRDRRASSPTSAA